MTPDVSDPGALPSAKLQQEDESESNPGRSLAPPSIFTPTPEDMASSAPTSKESRASREDNASLVDRASNPGSGRLSKQLEHVTQLMDKVVDEAIQAADLSRESSSALLADRAFFLDSYHLEFRLWLNDIVDEDASPDVCVADILDIVEDKSIAVTHDLMRVFKEIEASLEAVASSSSESVKFFQSSRELYKASRVWYQLTTTLSLERGGCCRKSCNSIWKSCAAIKS